MQAVFGFRRRFESFPNSRGAFEIRMLARRIVPWPSIGSQHIRGRNFWNAVPIRVAMRPTTNFVREADVALVDAIESLKRAFPPHPIDPTNAFAEWGGTYIDASAFRDGVRTRPWTGLDGDFLEHLHDALVFLGPESVPEYLPAYLSKLVTRDPALSALPSFLLAVLTRGDGRERFDARFSRLTAAQVSAVGQALAAFESELEGSSRQPDVTASLDSYWRGQIGGQ
jgi:hypothetical protein